MAKQKQDNKVADNKLLNLKDKIRDLIGDYQEGVYGDTDLKNFVKQLEIISEV